MKQVAEGYTILKRYGPHKNACWVLENNGEAAVVDMPPYSAGERPPYQRAESYTRTRKLRLKYGLLSHSHRDHSLTLPYFRRWFPSTRFVGHRSLMDDRGMAWMLSRTPGFPFQDWADGRFTIFDELFDGQIWTGDLGGEPLHIIHAPKHSWSDQLIIFKGAMITGDWVVGDLRDCNAIVPTDVKLESIERVKDLVKSLNYHIHMLFSAHGDCLYYDVDFFRMMERSKFVHRN
jgi:glyoxylase-like metal-dependent hydrolase (beta-lactamase superfamily II)